MKFACGKRSADIYAARKKWHRWFAWHPVSVGEHDCRWLEFVERRGEVVGCYDAAWWDWEYRSVK